MLINIKQYMNKHQPTQRWFRYAFFIRKFQDQAGNRHKLPVYVKDVIDPVRVQYTCLDSQGRLVEDVCPYNQLYVCPFECGMEMMRKTLCLIRRTGFVNYQRGIPWDQLEFTSVVCMYHGELLVNPVVMPQDMYVLVMTLSHLDKLINRKFDYEPTIVGDTFYQRLSPNMFAVGARNGPTKQEALVLWRDFEVGKLNRATHELQLKPEYKFLNLEPGLCIVRPQVSDQSKSA